MKALPHDARSLFAAARQDGPDAHERDAVFRSVALATGIAAEAAAAMVSTAPTMAGATASAGAAPTASAFSLKILAMGALIGAASTALGVLLTITLVMPEPPPAGGAAGATKGNVGATSGEVFETRPGAPRMRAAASGAKLAVPGTRGRDTAGAETKPKAVAETPRVETNASSDGPSDLAEEARLVTAARTALVAGDAVRALSLVQATRKLGARALEPEELGLEARALRALGRADDAAATELVLRRRYPESALAR